MRRLLRRALPWALAALILGYLFREVPLGDAWQAAREARLRLFVPALLGAVLLWFLIESRAFAFLFSRFHVPVSWAEARSLRAMTYLVTPLNWNLGTAAIVLHLRRSKGIGALESSSSLLFYSGIDGFVLGSLTLLGVSLLPESETTRGIARGAAIFVGVIAVWLGALLARRPDWSWLRWLRGRRIFQTHVRAGLGDVGVLVGLRALYFSGFVLLFWLGSRAFHVDLPLVLALASTPPILLSAALPITPAGLGTQQAAILYFFSAHGTQAAILAFALVFPVALIVARLPLGLLYLRDLRKLRP
jgi:uncharacterized membrane protein YbhN (UPF0104 family)